jgi:hypothetical protein
LLNLKISKDKEDRDLRDGEVSIRVLVWVRKLRRARAGSGSVLDGLTVFAVVEIKSADIARKVCIFFFVSDGGGKYLLFGWCLGRMDGWVGWMGGVFESLIFCMRERGRYMI